VHLVFGFVAHRVGLTLTETTAMGLVNEVAEGWIRTNRPGAPFGGPESGRNIGVDLGANTAGWVLASLVCPKSAR